MKDLLIKLSLGQTLSEIEAESAIAALIKDQTVSDAQIGAFLMGFASRLPNALELTGAAKGLRQHALKFSVSASMQESLIDTCGTGGSGLNTFNTSTAVSLILASGGLAVAKHGNRALTSSCGSADVLQALGINIEASPEQMKSCLEKTNFCFLFAPLYHAATKRVQVIRRELGFRSLFNFLGPLSNPLSPRFQLVGISERAIQSDYIQALKALGLFRAMVVSADERLDEISLSGKTLVMELKNGQISSYEISPEDFGFKTVDYSEISGEPAEKAAITLRELFSGKKSAKRDLVLLNAGAAFYISGKSQSIAEGITNATQLVDSGKASSTLDNIINDLRV